MNLSINYTRTFIEMKYEVNRMKKGRPIDYKIFRSKEKINYLRRIISFSMYPYQKQYYNQLLMQEMRRLNQLKNSLDNNTREAQGPDLREFTIEELAENNGAGGKPAYVAVNGIVYDVSNEATWGGGTHFGLYAGKDVTNEFARCHGGSEILKNLTKVGILK